MKKFEKVEKTEIISTKFSLRCTPLSVILGLWVKVESRMIRSKIRFLKTLVILRQRLFDKSYVMKASAVHNLKGLS